MTLVASLIAFASGASVATPWLVAAGLALVTATVFMAYVKAARERDSKPTPVVHMTGGAGGHGFNAGGGGGVAAPGGYAEGGRGGAGVSMFDILGRTSYDTGISVRELAKSSGLSADDMHRSFGAGGDGGASRPPGPPTSDT